MSPARSSSERFIMRARTSALLIRLRSCQRQSFQSATLAWGNQRFMKARTDWRVAWATRAERSGARVRLAIGWGLDVERKPFSTFRGRSRDSSDVS